MIWLFNLVVGVAVCFGIPLAAVIALATWSRANPPRHP